MKQETSNMTAFFRQFRAALKSAALLAMLITACAGFSLAQSQSNAADLRGVITDPNGAVVAGATVTARNAAINVTRSSTTNEAGEYTIVNLPPGDYEVSVEAANFKRSVLPNVNLTIGQAADLNISLEICEQNVTVTVSDATTEVIETSRTAVSTTIDQQRIENLPINERSATGFAL
ncbi:MAG TPA: carboxypeptidase-like regulatory domain-containing protein, partial [Pyrinomonadaceae bacterium]|nr:carboxypeptidase-like regulatory domain-containing protein [Pyrinomonadaceae bacterium]